MKKLLAALPVLLLWSTLAQAQCAGLFPPNAVCGNVASSSSAPPRATVLPVLYASSYGVVCNGVADNTAAFTALSTAIGTGGKRVVLPRGRCLTGAWSLATKSNIIIEGQGGSDITEIVTGTDLVCTATGAGVCFDWSETRGIVVRDLVIAYSSNAFTGTLLGINHPTSVWASNAFDSVHFKQVINTGHNANTLVYVLNSAGTSFRNTKFTHATNGIVGDFNGGTPHGGTNISCNACMFIGISTAAIVNPGAEWTIAQSWFFSNTSNNPVGIISEAANVIESLTISGSSFTDGGAAGSWVNIGAINSYTHTGGHMGGGAAVGTGIVLGNVRGANITGVQFSNLSIGIQVTGTCDGVFISGSDAFSTTTPRSGMGGCTNSLSTGNSPTVMNDFGLGRANTFTQSQNIALSQAALTSITITNANTSTAAGSSIVLVSNSGTYAAAAANNPNGGGQAGITWTGSGGIAYASTHASGTIGFSTGGFNERLRILASGGIHVGGTAFDLGGPGRLNIQDYIVTAPKTVGTLPTCNATSNGARSFVTDSNATLTAGIGAVVAGGGANGVPVTCDAANWRIG